MAEQKKSGNKTIAENRKAFHDYFVEESYEAGIELCGTEVKALRAGGVNLNGNLHRLEAGHIVHGSGGLGSSFLKRRNDHDLICVSVSVGINKENISGIHLEPATRRTYPKGTLLNPYELTIGEVVTIIREGNEQGVVYLYTATADGTVAATMACEYLDKTE